jgi:IS5 family transposase
MTSLLAFVVVTAILASPFVLAWLLYRRWHKAHTPKTLSEHEAQRQLYPAPQRVEYKALAASRNGSEGD